MAPVAGSGSCPSWMARVSKSIVASILRPPQIEDRDEPAERGPIVGVPPFGPERVEIAIRAEKPADEEDRTDSQRNELQDADDGLPVIRRVRFGKRVRAAVDDPVEEVVAIPIGPDCDRVEQRDQNEDDDRPLRAFAKRLEVHGKSMLTAPTKRAKLRNGLSSDTGLTPGSQYTEFTRRTPFLRSKTGSMRPISRSPRRMGRT